MELASLEDIREHIGYDPVTGVFIWLKDMNLAVPVGSSAGTWNWGGYLCICFRRRRYRAQRLAWLLTFGRWPTHQIDHIDGNKKNNRLCNLREATSRENLFNRKGRKSVVGLKGVSIGRNGRFRALIRLDGKQKYLGEFSTAEAAHSVYVDAAKKLHGEFARLS